jgi:hypothetical protein
MRKLLFALTSVIAVTVAPPSRATVMDFTGEMFVRIGATIPPGILTGSGTASLQTSTGGKVTQLTIPPGFFSDRTFLPVPNAFPIIQVVLTGVAGANPLRNHTIMLTDGNGCDAGHLTSFGNGNLRGVRCPGGKLAGFGGLDGSAFVGLFFSQGSFHTSVSSTSFAALVHTPGSSTTAASSQHTFGSGVTFGDDFPLPVANLSVPLSNVGSGSRTTITAGGIRITVTGAGWTTGTAAIYNPTNSVFVHLPGTTHLPNSISFVASQSFPTDTGSVETLMGFQGTTGMGKLQIQLVTPVQVLNNATNEFSNTIARITLTQAPEPGELLLLGLGVVAFSLYGTWRMRQ